MKTYTPRAGSIAVRAYAYLQRHAGEWIPNARLAETLQSDNSSIIQSLRTALERKLIERRSEGRLVFWRMPKAAGAQPELEPESDSDDGRPTQRTVPAPSRDPALTGGLFRVRSAFDMVPRPPSSPDDDEDAVPATIDAPAPPPAARPYEHTAAQAIDRMISKVRGLATPGTLRFALWSDKTLQVHRANGELVELSPDETRGLFRYLDEISRRVDVEEQGA